MSRPKVLVVDDSAVHLRLAIEVLEEGGYEVAGCASGEDAVARVHELRPECVLCDVTLPTLSGFDVCRAIKSDAALADTTVIMFSSKAYDADRARARHAGADGFIVKPLTLEKFERVLESAGRMKLEVWGVRGTMPVPREGYIGYGGNTNCYSLRFPDHAYIVFDAGTGIKRLADALLGRGETRIAADIFITHPHWDHIQGFPFFTPLYIPGNDVHVRGAAQGHVGFEDLILHQMDGVYFPVTAREFGARVRFTEIAECETTAAGAIVRSMYLKHPGNCLGYRVDYRGRSFCYITDNELYPRGHELADPVFEERLVSFCRGADIMLHDCTYRDEVYDSKVSYGHSRPLEVCRIAHEAEVGALLVHHHDPDQDDRSIEQKFTQCQKHLSALGSRTEVILPREGEGIIV